jgi:hypothetical protein
MQTGVRFAIAFAIAIGAPATAQGAGATLHHASLVIARPTLVRAVAPRSLAQPALAPRGAAQTIRPAKLPDRPASAPQPYNPLVRRHMAMRSLTVSDLTY